jgi:hypothetical protein
MQATITLVVGFVVLMATSLDSCPRAHEGDGTSLLFKPRDEQNVTTETGWRHLANFFVRSCPVAGADSAYQGEETTEIINQRKGKTMSATRDNRFTPSCEGLEDRCLLSAVHVFPSLSVRHHHRPHHARHAHQQSSVPPITIHSTTPSTSMSGSTSTGGISVDSGSFTINALGAAVEQFAENLVGQPAVGSGQCTDLVQQALMHAGARSWYNYDVFGNPVVNDDPNHAPYVWGRLVATYSAGQSAAGLDANTVEPGDIIQYANVVTSTSIANHHSAIVAWNSGNGQMQVLEQNAGTPNVVRKDSEDFSTMTQGTIWIYRPLSA